MAEVWDPVQGHLCHILLVKAWGLSVLIASLVFGVGPPPSYVLGISWSLCLLSRDNQCSVAWERRWRDQVVFIGSFSLAGLCILGVRLPPLSPPAPSVCLTAVSSFLTLIKSLTAVLLDQSVFRLLKVCCYSLFSHYFCPCGVLNFKNFPCYNFSGILLLRL